MENSIFYMLAGFAFLVILGLVIVRSDNNNPIKRQNNASQGHLKQIELSAFLAEPKVDTTNWESARVYIDDWGVPVKVVGNRAVAGYLIDLFVRFNDINFSNTIHPIAGLNVIKKYYFPKFHLHSFGKYTALIVLYNPRNPTEMIPDPDQKPWHYEVIVKQG